MRVRIDSSVPCGAPAAGVTACIQSGLQTLMGGARVKIVKLVSCSSSQYDFKAAVVAATPQATLAAAVQSLRASLLSALPTLPTCAPSLAATGGTAVLHASYAMVMTPQTSGGQPYPRGSTSRAAEIVVGSGTNTATFNFTTGWRRQGPGGGVAAQAATLVAAQAAPRALQPSPLPHLSFPVPRFPPRHRLTHPVPDLQ
jgi:hypothetical protein